MIFISIYSHSYVCVNAMTQKRLLGHMGVMSYVTLQTMYILCDAWFAIIPNENLHAASYDAVRRYNYIQFYVLNVIFRTSRSVLRTTWYGGR